MVSTAPLALRFPKQHPRFYNVKTSWNTETIDGNVHYKIDAQEACYAAPRKYGEVAKVIFWAAIRNTDAVLDFDGRLRIWWAGTVDDPTQPDFVTIGAGTRSNAAADFNTASIGNKRFSKAGPRTTIVPNTPGTGAIVSVEFDLFDLQSQDFFTAWNSPTEIDDYVQCLMALEVFSGSSTSFQLGDWGYVVVQAPSPQNNTATYYQIGPGNQIPASGPVDYDEDNATTGRQFRGAFRWRYNADDWDGITSINLVLYYGTGSNTQNMAIRGSRLVSEAQGKLSTTELFTETVAVNIQQYGIWRSQNLLSLISDGDEICADWKHDGPASVVASGGIGADASFLLEITQRDCTKTVAYFGASSAVTRQKFGIMGGDFIPSAYITTSLLDPQWFANFPDELIPRRKFIGQINHSTAGLYDPNWELWMNADVTGDQNGNPGNSVTPSSTMLGDATSTPINTAGWKYREDDLLAEPLNFAGARRLFTRINGTWVGGVNGAPGHSSLMYAHTVPNTEVLDLGPLFPIGEFAPEGCASTSAGLGDPGVLVITNGSTLPQKFDPVSGLIEDAGIPVPFEGEFPQGAGALVVNNHPFSPNGGIVPGRYEYRYTFRNCCTGKESDPNPDTFVVDSAAAGASPGASHSISFANIRIPADPQICEICIYRTVKDGAFPIMAKVGCINIDQTTVFVDTVPDSVLDFTADPLALLNGPMPCVPVVVEYRNRLFGLGDIPQLAPPGTVSVVNGSKYVVGDDAVAWDRCLEGKFIQIGNDCRAYEIERILPPPFAGNSPGVGQLKLVEEYEGTTDTGLSFVICGHQNRLFFSEPLEAECWPPINFLDVEPGDGDKLMGGASNFDALVICKRRKTYVLRFRDNPLLEVNVPSRISTDIGCIGPRSFAQVENGTVWLSDRGLAMFDGRGVQHIEESDRFNEMLIDPDNPRYVRRDSQGRVIDAVGVFYPKREQYLLLLPTVQTSRGANVMLVWDTSLRNITLYEFCQEFQSMVVAKDSEGNQRVYLGDVNGFVWMFDVGDTDGVGFPGATGTVRGTVTAAGREQGASFLDDSSASFLTGGLPQLAALSGVEGLTPAFGSTSPDASGQLGFAGACVFVRKADADPDDPWIERLVYASTETRLYVSPGWDTVPDETYEYMIGAIEFDARFKPTQYGSDDTLKRNWSEVVTFDPVPTSSQLRVELRPDLASVDDEEETVVDENEAVTRRVFDLSNSRGRITRPVGRRIHNYMQVRMTNFAPDEPIRILNHALRMEPRTQ